MVGVEVFTSGICESHCCGGYEWAGKIQCLYLPLETMTYSLYKVKMNKRASQIG